MPVEICLRNREPSRIEAGVDGRGARGNEGHNSAALSKKRAGCNLGMKHHGQKTIKVHTFAASDELRQRLGHDRVAGGVPGTARGDVDSSQDLQRGTGKSTHRGGLHLRGKEGVGANGWGDISTRERCSIDGRTCPRPTQQGLRRDDLKFAQARGPAVNAGDGIDRCGCTRLYPR